MTNVGQAVPPRLKQCAVLRPLNKRPAEFCLVIRLFGPSGEGLPVRGYFLVSFARWKMLRWTAVRLLSMNTQSMACLSPCGDRRFSSKGWIEGHYGMPRRRTGWLTMRNGSGRKQVSFRRELAGLRQLLVKFAALLSRISLDLFRVLRPRYRRCERVHPWASSSSRFRRMYSAANVGGKT